MVNRTPRISGIVLILFLQFILFGVSRGQTTQSRPFVTAYYADFSMYHYPPELVDYTAMTHIVHFAVGVTTTPPYLTVLVNASDSIRLETIGTNRNVQKALIDSAHAHGVKVLLGIANVATYGGDNTIMTYVSSDSARCRLWVNSTLEYCRRKGYDGIDINWEWPNNADEPGYTRMMKFFREGLDKWPVRGEIAHALYPADGFGTGAKIRGAYNIPLLNQYVDQHNIELYGLQAWQTNLHLGYTSAINKGTVEPGGSVYDAITYADSLNSNGQNVGPLGLARAGWDKSKIGVSVGYLYWHMQSPSPMPIGGTNLGSWVNFTRSWYSDMIGTKSGQFGMYPRQWDDRAKAPYKRWQDTTGYHFITYEDSQSVAAKAQWTKDNGFGGLMIFELGAGYITTDSRYAWSVPWYTGVKDPLLQAVKKVFGETVVTPPPPPPDLPKIKGSLFFDQNQNHSRGSSERAMAGWKVTLSGPQDAVHLTDSSGSFSFNALPTGVYTVTLQQKGGWTPTLPSGSYSYTVSVDSADQTTTLSFGLYSPAAFDFAMTRQWNIVSLPVVVQDRSAAGVFPLANTKMFSFEPEEAGYVERNTLEYGEGYWVKFPFGHTVWLSGTTLQTDTSVVAKGWNFIGSVSVPIPVSDIRTEPPGLLQPYVYGYQNGSFVTESIQPGLGYWVNARDAGKVILSSVPAGSNDAAGFSRETEHPVNRISFTLESGNTSNLYYVFSGTGPAGITLSEAPPAAPGETFAAVFTGQEGISGPVATLGPANGGGMELPIVVNGVDGSALTVSWDVGDPGREVLLTGAGGFKQSLSGNGTVKLTGTAIPGTGAAGGIPFSLEVAGEDQASVPESFTLEQNYPNPFNSTTLINFSLPVTAHVKLEVFNVIGELIGTLADDTMESGFHSVPFEGAEVASGMYFYRLTAEGGVTGRFTAVKKLLLIR